MTYGLLGLPMANIRLGPGNRLVFEARRMLFGREGIDVISGPTDSLFLTDAKADFSLSLKTSSVKQSTAVTLPYDW